ncbi:ABC transporter ATP-binding protein [Roseibium limicola]|uniref:ATP-binding cassette domain-containing protein n=1 Tax=Roseibium limicola TaxID=2816037 RepID=A0A939EPG1_9HYPH|nr:ATP-binding cassette domain-containing protein [Roseibium limicola]MBO0346346.1 ATP-binding cassette domain-containing protein [Roseibium limicola]
MALHIEDITKFYGTNQVLDQVNLSMQDGEFIALLGPSGSGKTSLLRIIAGLQFADGGRLSFDGEDITGVDARLRRFGMVFQSYALFEHMSVVDNVAFGLKMRPRANRPNKGEISDRVRKLLDMAEISELGERFPSQLSGGQRQRVALTRALAIEPRLLLLDEPFSALDTKVRKGLRGALRDLQKKVGIGAILVTHDQEEAFEIADRIAIMADGKIQQFDTPNNLLRSPATPFVSEFLEGMGSYHAAGAGI